MLRVLFAKLLNTATQWRWSSVTLECASLFLNLLAVFSSMSAIWASAPILLPLQLLRDGGSIS